MSYYAPAPPPGGPGYPSVTVTTTNKPCSTVHIVIAWIFAVLTVGLLLPWAIAATRSHKDVVAIALINWLLAWTLIVWVICLIWSLSSPGQQVTMTATASPGYAYPPAPCPPSQQQWSAQPLSGRSAWSATRPLPPAATPWSAPSADARPTMPLPSIQPPSQPPAEWSPWQEPRG